MKKGFTLVELLAVIVILAVVALIAMPTIMKMVDESKEKAAIQSVNGILEAGNNYVVDEALSQNPKTKITLDLKNTDLEYKGTRPEKGTLLIKEGKMSVIAKIGKYCVEKKFNEESPKIIESETCEIGESEIIKYEGKIALNTSGNDCVTDSTKTCTTEETKTGLKVSVNVNDNENYEFYVIKDNGNGTINLLLDHSVGTSAWASIADYNAVSDVECDNTSGCNMYGPVTALKFLKEKTNNWTNIETRTDKYTYPSQIIDMKDYRARLLLVSESQNWIGCGWVQADGSNKESCPEWFRKTRNFWLLDGINENYKAGLAIWSGSVNGTYTSNETGGIVPVITIQKSSIY